MQPNIETERLILRPFRLSDSERVVELAGDKIIADMTANIPHPYKPNIAVDWIESHKAQYIENKGVIYAITLKDDDSIIGTVGFSKLENGFGLLGYWLGVQYWGCGIAFEASKSLVEHCKLYSGLIGLQVMHLAENERSKSVIKKLGVTYIENDIIRMRGQDREVCIYKSLI
ncbi:MAG: RimJ/RimL family protein N-acetyltransferase [Alteromonadaceae bacterium]|jgi:RimJ/RimL family protein N-acetyltransferase